MFVVGQIARYHPVKDHETSLRAFAAFAARVPDACMMLVGSGTGEDNTRLTVQITKLGLCGRVRRLGQRTDIHRVSAALDVAVCSSTAESFPNVIGEAMACGVPCIVTDVGDCSWIVGGHGYVVPSGDSQRMAEFLECVYRQPAGERARLGAAARQRIQSQFSLAEAVRRYERAYTECTEGTRDRERE